VALGRGRQQLLPDPVIDLDGPSNDWALDFLHRGVESALQSGPQNGGEDAGHRLGAHLGEGDEVEVAQEAVSDRVTPAPRGAHAAHELDVDELAEGAWGLSLVPGKEERKHVRNELSLERVLRELRIEDRRVVQVAQGRGQWPRVWPCSPRIGCR
jgi:hypothetical protein